MLKKPLEDIEDLWPKVEGLVQTQKAIILHCISLFPEEHCACKYLINLLNGTLRTALSPVLSCEEGDPLDSCFGNE